MRFKLFAYGRSSTTMMMSCMYTLVSKYDGGDDKKLESETVQSVLSRPNFQNLNVATFGSRCRGVLCTDRSIEYCGSLCIQSRILALQFKLQTR